LKHYTIVSYNIEKGSEVEKVSKKKICPDPCDLLASDGISGNFNILCGQSDITLWSTIEVTSAGTVTIYYGEGCSDALLVTVIDSLGGIDTFSVPQKNTRSRTYASLSEVRITCPAGVNQFPCYGSYCIDLNYFV
jgi:hypothetical protein